MSMATDDVLAERRRQIEAEGWTEAHDDQHTDGGLAAAAACYAMHSALEEGIRSGHIARYCNRTRPFDRFVPDYWPWQMEWWKPTSARRNLVKAAALLIAEIERLDRAATKTPNVEVERRPQAREARLWASARTTGWASPRVLLLYLHVNDVLELLAMRQLRGLREQLR